MSLSIAIIGAGTAGLASARFLHALGHQITIFERADALHPVGAGILLQPSGQHVLHKLGVLESLKTLSNPIETLHGDSLIECSNQRDNKGTTHKPIMTLHYRDSPRAIDDKCGHPTNGLGVHRANLCHVLASQLSSDISLRYGLDIHRYKSTRDAVELFTGSTRRHEVSLGTFDAVIVANGSKSTLRPRGFCKPYKWGAYWSIVPNTSCTPASMLAQRYHKANRMAGLLPSGYLHNDTAKKPLISLFWSVPTKKLIHVREQGLAAWKTDVLRLWPEIASVIDQITDFSQLIPATYQDVYMRKWHAGRVLFVGDAGHGTSPQLGQGANLALVDAQILASCLAKNIDPQQAWKHYSKQRQAQLYYYVFASRWLTYGFQSHSRVLPWLRDRMTLPMSNPNYWLTRKIYQQMLLTLTGHKTGIWSSQLPQATPEQSPHLELAKEDTQKID